MMVAPRAKSPARHPNVARFLVSAHERFGSQNSYASCYTPRCRSSSTFRMRERTAAGANELYELTSERAAAGSMILTFNRSLARRLRGPVACMTSCAKRLRPNGTRER
jgi:hypothetical protein